MIQGVADLNGFYERERWRLEKGDGLEDRNDNHVI
jgi:hypothetical protein